MDMMPPLMIFCALYKLVSDITGNVDRNFLKLNKMLNQPIPTNLPNLQDVDNKHCGQL